MRLSVALVFVWLASSCGADDGGKRDKSGGGSGSGGRGGGGGRHVVMVIDDGFDVDHPVFDGKVAGSYTIACPEPEQNKIAWEDLSLAALKEALLEAYRDTSGSCSVTKGLSLKKSPSFADIADDREAWNDGVLSKEGVDLSKARYDEIAAVVSGEDGYSYHGTGTAGVIAYDNADVRLVLVQFELSDDSEAAAKVECRDQATMDRFVEANSDEEVFEAYVKRPDDPVNVELGEIAKEHGVDMVNLSLGGQSREKLEALYKEKGCGNVDLRAYYKQDWEMRAARAEFLQDESDVEVLVIQSAGNDGVAIESPADTGECSDPPNGIVVVGSIDADGAISDFSNTGACVDVYALGDQVVVAAPDGFVTVASGTSFSAPMAARFATRTLATGLSISDMREELIATRNSKGYLPSEASPAELAFDNTKAIATYALWPWEANAANAARLARLGETMSWRLHFGN